MHRDDSRKLTLQPLLRRSYLPDDVPHARHHAEDLAHRAQPADLLNLADKVGERERGPLAIVRSQHVYRLFFFRFRSFGADHPLFFVFSIGPPGMPRFDSPPPINDFISFSFPSMFIPPTARIMSRLMLNCLMKLLTSCTSTPAPAAILRRRPCSITSGFFLSARVI